MHKITITSKQLPSLLKSKRLEYGLTMTQMSFLLGMKPRMLAKWEAGCVTRCSFKHYMGICCVLSDIWEPLLPEVRQKNRETLVFIRKLQGLFGMINNGDKAFEELSSLVSNSMKLLTTEEMPEAASSVQSVESHAEDSATVDK